MGGGNPIAVEQYICGGYFIARLARRDDRWMDGELLQEKVLSASRCVCATVPDDWAISWERRDKQVRQEAAALFNIPATRLYDLVQWTTVQMNDGRMGWPNVFYTLSLAREFVRQFVPLHSDLRLCGLGLHKQMIGQFLEEAEPCEPANHPAGVYQAISRGYSLEESGKVLGFELLGYKHGNLHSWTCNVLQRTIADELGIRPNGLGFIESVSAAQRATQYLREGRVGKEPGWWAEWLMVQYEL